MSIPVIFTPEGQVPFESFYEDFQSFIQAQDAILFERNQISYNEEQVEHSRDTLLDQGLSCIIQLKPVLLPEPY